MLLRQKAFGATLMAPAQNPLLELQIKKSPTAKLLYTHLDIGLLFYYFIFYLITFSYSVVFLSFLIGLQCKGVVQLKSN